MQSSFTFELDGESLRVDGEPVHRNLADFLHSRGFGRESRFRNPDPWLGGAPLILLDMDGRGRPALRSVDAALIPLPAIAGRQLWSAEGIVLRASRGEIHPAFALLDSHPELECSWAGRARILTALFEGYYRSDLQVVGQLNDQLDGCLSRTAHYIALREVAEELFAEAQQQRHEAQLSAQSQGREVEFEQGRVDIFGDEFSALLAGEMPEPEDFSYVDPEKRRFYRPQTIIDLAKLLAQFPKAVIVGGSAGLLNPENRNDWDCLISTEGVGDLRALYDKGDRWDIGAAAPLTSINELIGKTYPAFGKALRRFATRPIRNRITLGGCLAAARHDDELAPVLIALDAQVRAISLEGEREIPVARFFEGKGKTNLRPSEVIADILLPRFTGEALKERGCRTRFCDTYKAAPRRELSSGSVSAGFAVELDDAGKIAHAWIAYGGLADRTYRARETETALVGKPWSEDTIFGSLSQLTREIQNAPGARDLATALPQGEIDYRRQLIITLLQKFYYQHPKADGPPVELGVTSEMLQPNRRFFQPSGAA
ncbi:MAG: FAD binding domain-containing protein [Verrucomicrobiae bacterium]|nr:FAD binding domain-containing protein [Verrucomicrobiae bacterium]